jgi:hypothetical protein
MSTHPDHEKTPTVDMNAEQLAKVIRDARAKGHRDALLAAATEADKFGHGELAAHLREISKQ